MMKFLLRKRLQLYFSNILNTAISMQFTAPFITFLEINFMNQNFLFSISHIEFNMQLSNQTE